MTLTLYHFQGCPYCARVRDYLDSQSISVPMKDIHQDPGAKEELIKISGKSQVPCLVVDAKPMFESLDIIEWFKRTYKK